MGAFLKKLGKKDVIPDKDGKENAVLEKNGRKIANVQVLRDRGYYMSPPEAQAIESPDSKALIPSIPVGHGMLEANLILSRRVYSEYFLSQTGRSEFNEGLVLISDSPDVTYEGCKIVKLNGNVTGKDVCVVSADVMYTSKHPRGI